VPRFPSAPAASLFVDPAARVARCLRCRATSRTTRENKHDIGLNVAVEPMPCPRPTQRVRACRKHSTLVLACRWARRLLLDRRCPNLFDAFCALVVAQWPLSVLPATEVRSTAPVSAHAQRTKVLGVRRIVGMRARTRVGVRVLSDHSGIAIVIPSRVTVHFLIARVLYLMRARRTP
jgi:hypothetical protein